MKHLLLIWTIFLAVTAFVFINSHSNVDYLSQAEFDYRYQN